MAGALGKGSGSPKGSELIFEVSGVLKGVGALAPR